MGYFNATCQISQLPITAGTPVRFLLLVKNPLTMDSFVSQHKSFDRRTKKLIRLYKIPTGVQHKLKFTWKYFKFTCEDIWEVIVSKFKKPIKEIHSETSQESCFSTDFWSPDFVPLKGLYDGSGSVDDLDQTSLNALFWKEEVDRRLVELDIGSNKVWDLPSKKGMNLDQFLNASAFGRIRFKDGYSNLDLPVCQTMIREDVYQTMLKIPLNSDGWASMEINHPDVIYKDALKTLAVPYNEHQQYPTKEDPIFDTRYLYHDQNKGPFLRNFDLISGGEKGLNPIRDWITDQLRFNKITLDQPELASFIKDIAEFMYVKLVMNRLRKTWHPGCGRGSSQENFELASSFNQSLAAIAKQEHLKQLKEEEEELEESEVE